MLSISLMTAACSQPTDIADNLPLSGKWSDETKLSAFEIGGTAQDVEQIRGKIGIKDGVTEFCGEPYFKTKEAFQAELDKSNKLDCNVGEVSDSGSTVSTKGICSKKLARGITGSTFFTGKANLAADKVDYNMTFNVVAEDDESGDSEMMSVYVKRKMVRLGEC